LYLLQALSFSVSVGSEARNRLAGLPRLLLSLPQLPTLYYCLRCWSHL